MSQCLHGCTLTKEIPNSTLTLYFEYFDGHCGLSPSTLVDDAVSSLWYLFLECEFFEVDLEVVVEGSWLHTNLLE